MIFDRIENMPLYYQADARLERAYAFIKTVSEGNLSFGRHELGENGMYANIEKYTTQPAAGRNAEAHRRYIDVQFVLSGKERIGYAPVSGLKESGGFDAEHDISFYSGECETWVCLLPGTFAVIYPHEGHIPCTRMGGPMRGR